MTFSYDLTFSFGPLSSCFKLFIIFFFSLRSFSNSSNFCDISLTDCVRSASCLPPLICMDLVSLLRLYISDIFTFRVLRYSNTSEISFVMLTCWNTSSSAHRYCCLWKFLLWLFFFSSGLHSPLRSLLLEILLKYLLILLVLLFVSTYSVKLTKV